MSSNQQAQGLRSATWLSQSTDRWAAVTPSLAILFLGTLPVIYLAALLALLLNQYVALAGALALTGLVGLSRPEIRWDALNRQQIALVAVGMILVAQMREPVWRLDWDVVSYGLMKYPEMKRGIVGPYFSYGHVYEFMVSYVNELLPPATGLAFGHSLSLVFLGVGTLSYAATTRSVAAIATCLLLLFHDLTGVVSPYLAYAYAGKNDVLLAAVVLLVWAVFLERRWRRDRPVTSVEVVTTSALVAYAVGLKTSAIVAVGLPLLAYWWEFACAATWCRIVKAACLAGVAWLFFGWQYLGNIIVLGHIVDPALSAIGMRLSVAGTRWPMSLGVFGCACALVALIVLALFQRAGREVFLIRTSALLLFVLCPFFLYDWQRPQWRLVLPVLFLLGADAAGTLTNAARRVVFGSS